MGDPKGPWQDYGQHDRPDDGAPRQLPSSWGLPPPPTGAPPQGLPPPTGRPYGDHGPPDDVTDAVVPYFYSASPTAPSGPAHGAGDQGPAGYDGGPAPALEPYPTAPAHVGNRHPDLPPVGASYADGEWYVDPDDPDEPAPWSLRQALSDMAWRYRSAPFWARVTADLTLAGIMLALIVATSLTLRHDSDPQPAAAAREAPTTTAPTTSTTEAPTTTAPTTTTTTAPTTTTEPPPTTTAAPVVAPPTTLPPTTAPPTTAPEPVVYRDCRDAFVAGALPLYRGQPGYAPHLDRDGDGEACEWDDREDDRDR